MIRNPEQGSENQTHTQSEEDNQLVDDLRNAVNDLLPTVKKGVHILLEGEYNHFQIQENDLRGHVCGRVVRVLGYLLRTRNFPAQGFEDKSLGGWYPSTDHALLVVPTPTNKKVIVDGSYQQFLSIFYLRDEDLPQEEVLIGMESTFEKKAREFAGLRDLKLSLHPNPEIFKHFPFDARAEQLVQYFQRIWLLEKYKPIARNLEQDIEQYKQSPGSVSKLTRKLIEELNLV